MAAHTSTQRQFIVRKLAEFYTANEIIGQFRANWPDTDCGEPDVLACDPRIVVSSPEEFDLFTRARAAELVELNRLWPEIPETLQVLLRSLTRDYQVQRNRNDFALANKTAAEIAKIEGGFYAGKGPAKEASAPGTDMRPIGGVTYTIVDPAPVAEAACQTAEI